MAYRHAWGGVAIVALLAGTVVAVACGARSELESGEPRGEAGQAPRDGGVDARPDADAPVDAPEDAPVDAPKECEDPDTTYIYVVSSETELLAFKPQSNTFESRGFLFCPDTSSTPFSMAVDRIGTAHVVYDDGQLFRVSVADASCEATDFVVGQNGFQRFGMGFERAPGKKGGETLYVAEISWMGPSKGLASIDLDTYELIFVGPFSENPGDAIELTPTGDGPLNGYFLNNPGPGGTLVEIDTTDATIVSSQPLPVGLSASSLAVAWWGGFFYIFTGQSGAGSTVTRFDPVSQQTAVVATSPLTIVGAGVSTCAPGPTP